jgi:zinc/manganese transport system permease protein
MTVVVALNPLTGISHMLPHPFLARAFQSGTFIAAACGLVGYFVVLRGQVFTGDALSHVAFTGALAALAAGIDLRIGLFVGCVLFGAAMAALGPRGRADDVVIGNLFAWILGLGVLFLTLYTTSRRRGNGTTGVNLLFGSIFGLSASQTTVAVAIAAGLIIVMIAIARPLLFASIDETAAAAAGVPVRALGIGFLALVGVTAGEATQAVGALLLLGLLSAPAAAAQRLTARPYAALGLSVVLAVAAMWAGLTTAYAAPTLPPSFTILAFATGTYLLALLLTWARRNQHGSRVNSGAQSLLPCRTRSNLESSNSATRPQHTIR